MTKNSNYFIVAVISVSVRVVTLIERKKKLIIFYLRSVYIVQPIGVSGLHNITLKAKSALKLMCRAKGNPMPALQWFKDGVPILVGRRRIQYKK